MHKWPSIPVYYYFSYLLDGIDEIGRERKRERERNGKARLSSSPNQILTSPSLPLSVYVVVVAVKRDIKVPTKYS